MNLPRHYSYKPRLSLAFWLFGVALTWLVATGIMCGCTLHGFTLWYCIAQIILGLLLSIRWAFDCYLVLDKDSLTLPTGFGRVRTIRMPYSSIERVWEKSLTFGTVVLCLATKKGKFEIVAGMLPDAGSYSDVRKFLYAQVDRRNR